MVDDIAAEVEAMISFEALGHIEQDRLIEILWISEHLVLRTAQRLDCWRLKRLLLQVPTIHRSSLRPLGLSKARFALALFR